MNDYDLNFGNNKDWSYGGNSGYGKSTPASRFNPNQFNTSAEPALSSSFSMDDFSIGSSIGGGSSAYSPSDFNFGGSFAGSGTDTSNMPQLQSVGTSGIPTLNDSTSNLANAQMDYMDSMTNIAKDSAASQSTLGAWGVGIQGISAIGNIALGIKNYHMAKKQFSLEKAGMTTNVNNQVAALTNTIKDRSDMANWGSGGQEAKQAWEEDRMKNISNLDGKINTDEYRSKRVAEPKEKEEEA